ncbi:MAG: 2-C-methyl-D-erythritol 2,4-cyclodiphosphate synthase [bacterium]
MLSAIVLCAGSGTRFDKEKNKVLFKINNKRIFEYSVDLLLKKCDEVIIVCQKEEESLFNYKNAKIVYGSNYRHLSVLNGLKEALYDTVLIHDGARPFLQEDDLDNLINKLKTNDAAFLAKKVVNTIKTTDLNTLDRNNLIEALTPQGGSKQLFIDGINECIKTNVVPTDDISCIENMNKKIEIVFSSEKNIKITTKEDYEMNNVKIPKIGHSFDIHQLVEGRDLYLGGIKLDYHLGLLGHSDADCLLHAISESMLGALSLGDLGTIFPDNDPKYKGIDSKEILKYINKLIIEKGYVVGNIDSTVYLELPKMKPHILSIRECISQILNIDIELISVKATTYEKLGPIGEGKAIAAEAVCLLVQK